MERSDVSIGGGWSGWLAAALAQAGSAHDNRSRDPTHAPARPMTDDARRRCTFSSKRMFDTVGISDYFEEAARRPPH